MNDYVENTRMDETDNNIIPQIIKKVRNRKNDAKLTEEQRKRKQERARERYANLSKDERRKRAGRTKLTEKQRQNKLLHSRGYSLSQEQRERKREREIERRSRLTEEDRKRKSEYERRRRLNFTEEQRKNLAEYSRQRRANFTEEDRQRIAEYERGRNEERARRAASEREERLNMIKELNVGQNPLRNVLDLLLRIRNGVINNDAINSLDTDLIIKVLEMFGFKSASKEIDIYCFIEILKKWNDWENPNVSNGYYEKMYCYLESNLNKLKRLKKIVIKREFNNLQDICEDVIITSCSLKKLQTIFYDSSNKRLKYVHENPAFNLDFTEVQYIFNWPFISTQITFPEFSMVHQNINSNEFRFVDLTKNYKMDDHYFQTTQLFLKPSHESNTFLSKFIIKFFNQLRTVIINNECHHISPERKNEIFEAISEFENDLTLCYDTIETDTKYIINSNPHPYVRYLGYNDDGLINMSILDQKKNNNSINVKLQQICVPKISFVLEKFNLLYEVRDNDVYFIFDDFFLSKVNSCIHYKCLLCDVNLGSFSSSRRISNHLLSHHGFEPEWECANCNQSYSTNFLSRHRWKHNCIKVEDNT